MMTMNVWPYKKAQVGWMDIENEARKEARRLAADEEEEARYEGMSDMFSMAEQETEVELPEQIEEPTITPDSTVQLFKMWTEYYKHLSSGEWSEAEIDYEYENCKRVSTFVHILTENEERRLSRMENRLPVGIGVLLGGVRPRGQMPRRALRRGRAPPRRMRSPPRASMFTRGPFAPAVTVPLTYDDPVLIRTNIGGTTVSWRYKMNSAFDIDPAFASAAIPGFAEWSQAYRRYRVLKFNYSVEIANAEGFPTVVFCVPLQTDPGLNNAASYQFTGNERGQTHVSPSVAGGSARSFRGSIGIRRFSGNPGYLTDDNYAANTVALGGNPPTIFYFLIGATTGIFGLPPVFTAAGVTVRAKLTLITKFYQRYDLTA